MPPDSPAWTILAVLKWTAAFFDDRRVEGAQLSAELLLAHTLGIQRLDLYLRYDQPLSPEELASYRALIKRRAAGEPVAYILEEKAFWTKTFRVTPDVLIPRPDTECLVETALAVLPNAAVGIPFRVLEMGTGSGAVILAMAGESPHCFFTATDRSPRAMAVAKHNAKRHNLSSRVSFFVADWFAALCAGGAGMFDLIVVNPPYIAASQIDHLAVEVRDFEPRDALDGGADGLRDIRHIIQKGHRYLNPGGRLIMEIGWDQKVAVAQIVEATGTYLPPEFVKDLAGHDRVVSLRVK